MTDATTAVDATDVVRARPAGFLRDLSSVAARALRLIPREPESIVPALIVPLFFFFVNTGSLSSTFDYAAFQLPVAIIFAVTGVSRASSLVTDIQGGYFDRLLMTPMNRFALLLGLMVADFALVLALSIPVVVLGLIVGVSFATGVAGMVAFCVIAACWGVVFTGFPYAIALKTGSPAAVNSSFILFFPFAFLTTAFAPQEALSGWLATVARFNPVTYLLAALRSLVMEGWDATELAKGGAAIVAVGLVSLTLAFVALRGRVRRGG